jgi:IS5 family transposase
MGDKQLGSGDYEQSKAKKQTNSEKFLSELDQVVPWALTNLIEPFYPKRGSKGGRPPYPLATILLHGEESVVHADVGYQGIAKRP